MSELIKVTSSILSVLVSCYSDNRGVRWILDVLWAVRNVWIGRNENDVCSENIFHSKKVPSEIVSICNSVLIWTAKSHWVLIMSSTDVMDQTSPRYDQQQQHHSSTTAATATTQTSSAEPGAVLQPGPASSVIIGGKFVINHNKPILWRFYKILYWKL